MVSAESSKSMTPGKASLIAFQSGTFPMRFGNRRHFVSDVTTFFKSSTDGTYVARPTSQNTGLSPNCISGATVVANPHAGVTTSDPGGRSRAHRPRRMALLPEFTNSPRFFPKRSETLFSNSTVRSPKPASQPSRRHSSTALISSSPYDSNLLGAYQIFLDIVIYPVLLVLSSSITLPTSM